MANGKASTCDIELSDADLIAPPLYIPFFVIFPPSGEYSHNDVFDALKQGLQETLSDIAVGAGTIAYHEGSGRPYIQVDSSRSFALARNNLEGEEDFPSFEELSSRHYDPQLLDRSKLLPLASMPSENSFGMRTDLGTPVLRVQVNFIRGGIVLGFACHHWVFDAASMDIFVHAFAGKTKAYVQGSTPTQLRVSTERAFFNARTIEAAEANTIRQNLKSMDVVPADAAPANFLAATTAQRIQPLSLRIPSDRLNQLKADCRSADPTQYVSTYDCIAALTWRALIRARMEDAEVLKHTDTRLFTAMNVRGRGADPTYIGNGLAAPVAGPSNVPSLLETQGLADTALAVRTSIWAADPQHSSNMASLDRYVRPKERLEVNMDLNARDVLCSSWTFMRMDEYDFGFGPPAAARAVPMLVNNSLIMWPQTPGDRERQGQMLYVAVFKGLAEKLVDDPEWTKYVELVTS